MVNISTNINQTNNQLNSDHGQHITNINQTNNQLNSHGQHIHQYQPN